MNIILIGAPGAGKGTQVERLSHHLGLHTIVSGNLVRDAIEQKTAFGAKARAYVERGDLLPDELVIPLVLQHLSIPTRQQGVVIAGFPRTCAQAIALDQQLDQAGQHIDLVLYLRVSREQLLHRIVGRSICRAHQHVYNRYSYPPRVAGICDLDGSTLYQRSDDVGETLRRRLILFYQEVTPLLDYYRTGQKLVEIDGDQGIGQVYTSLLNTIHNRLEGTIAAE